MLILAAVALGGPARRRLREARRPGGTSQETPPGGSPSVTASPATPDLGPPARPVALERIRAAGGRLVDAAGREVVLRGFVTVTNLADGTPAAYTAADYRRMRVLGANYQALRLGAGALGFAADPGPARPTRRPGGPDPAYVERVAAMVALAREAGLYTSLKLTTYDLPALGAPATWEAIWRDSGGAQGRLLAAWRPLWDLLKDDPTVLGFDLLNEPQKGRLRATDDEFVASFLTPFYRKAVDALRAIAPQPLALFQPPFGAPPYRTAIQRDGVVYAPHFYPNLLPYLRRSDFSAAEYEPTLTRFLAEAALHGAPLLIGEYGMPWSAQRDRDASFQSRYQQLERAAVDLFDAHQLSATRPWFADDRAGIRLLDMDLNWALFRGREGTQGEERTFITDVIARPRPQLVAGEIASFTYDSGGRAFTLRYTPAAARGETELHIPRARHFAGGFRVRHSAGVLLVYDPTQPTGLRAVENAGGVDPGSFAWDEPRQVLTVREWLTGRPATLEIAPA